jgi:uncharacterized protein
VTDPVALFDQDFIVKNPLFFKKWERSAYQAFSEKLSHLTEKFPCIPATQGQRLGHFRYAFLKNPSSGASRNMLAEVLKQYGEISRDIGKYSSLIVFFKETTASTVDDYFKEFWSLLSALSERDKADWPEHIPPEPYHYEWEFCFDQEKYFMYCATPVHNKRKSRYFPFMMLAITPRWVIQKFNTANNSPKVKDSIRKRLAAYDTIEAHADLNVYGNDKNYEWKQYFLSDDENSPGKCPFEPLWKYKKSELK